jgi:hypothetical protein
MAPPLIACAQGFGAIRRRRIASTPACVFKSGHTDNAHDPDLPFVALQPGLVILEGGEVFRSANEFHNMALCTDSKYSASATANFTII